MKRSEMIEIIGNAQNDWIENIFLKLANKDQEYISLTEYLLNAIEQAGMLPPPKELDGVTGRILYYYVHDSIESQDREVDHEFNIPDDLWEPEDD